MVLLTGSTGFVGRQVLLQLHKRGIHPRLICRSDKAISGQLIHTPDLFAESVDWWANTLKGVDTIIHCAWYAEPGKYLQSPLNFDCLHGTIEMAKGAVSTGVKRFVGIGTCAEYDVSAGDISIDTPLNPTTIYAACKASAFLTLSQFLPLHGVAFSWCRLFYLYGDGEHPQRLVPYLKNKLSNNQPAELTSGNQVRDFIDVKDAALMIVETALGNTTGPVNICSGKGVTVRQLAEQIAGEKKHLLKFGARPDNAFDPPRVVGVIAPQ
jgi:nucleoside-diphosphate-sugar epimerase